MPKTDIEADPDEPGHLRLSLTDEEGRTVKVKLSNHDADQLGQALIAMADVSLGDPFGRMLEDFLRLPWQKKEDE